MFRKGGVEVQISIQPLAKIIKWKNYERYAIRISYPPDKSKINYLLSIQRLKGFNEGFSTHFKCCNNLI